MLVQDEASMREMEQQIQNAVSDTEREIVGIMLADYQAGYEKRKALLCSVETAAAGIGDPDARTAFRQFYLEHKPLKQMTDSRRRLFGKSRADYYKGIGAAEFMFNLEKSGFFRKTGS